MDRNNIEQMLEEMGHAPVPDPDELTVARIEQRWRSASEPRLAGATDDLTLGRARFARTVSRRPVHAGAIALVGVAACVGLIVIVQGRTADSDRIVVSDASDVVVVLPNGETVEPLAGERLPDGAVIEAGEKASGQIGAVDISPRGRYVVRDGSIAPYDRATASTTVASQPPTSLSPGGQTSVTNTSARGGTTSTAADEPKAPTTPPQVANPGSGARPTRLSVRAAVEPKPGGKGSRVRVTWTGDVRPGVRRYVVVRVRSWNGRTLPAGKRLASIRPGARRSAVDRNPKPGTFYVVAAIGPGNQVLAIGSVESPTTPG